MRCGSAVGGQVNHPFIAGICLLAAFCSLIGPSSYFHTLNSCQQFFGLIEHSASIDIKGLTGNREKFLDSGYLLLERSSIADRRAAYPAGTSPACGIGRGWPIGWPPPRFQ